MSHENRNSTAPPPQLSTVYSVQFQGNVNSGFQGCHPQDPPPKYEDVISGEYLKLDHSSCNYSSPQTIAPNFQSVDSTHHCTSPRVSTPQSESSFDENENKTSCCSRFQVICLIVFICVLIGRLYLRQKY